MPKRISSDAFLRILTARDFRFISQPGSHAKYRDSLGHTVIMPRARKSARLAYRGQSVLLHETFLIGNDGPVDIGTMLQNADKLLASCSHADHAAALKKQGWIAKDNTDFAAAIAVAKEAFKDNLDKKDETNDTTQQANALYLALLAIQNAANNEHDEDEPANRGIRAKYRLGLFPPYRPGNQNSIHRPHHPSRFLNPMPQITICLLSGTDCKAASPGQEHGNRLHRVHHSQLPHGSSGGSGTDGIPSTAHEGLVES